MFELDLIAVAADFVEVVHVELSGGRGTCRTNEDMFECLKYCGSTTYSKARTLWILNELGELDSSASAPYYAQLTIVSKRFSCRIA